MNPTRFNQTAWDNIATSPQGWFEPVSPKNIERARQGDFTIRLTACKPIPHHWLGDVRTKKILCLGAGGGHQGPLLAAAGANVTVLDLSEEQLRIDESVAVANQLTLKTIHADMADLSILHSDQFDLIVNPCSVNFCPNVLPVWNEAARVLQPGGALLTGLIQPINFVFDPQKLERGEFDAKFSIPYSDLDLPDDERDATLGPERPIDFGHSLDDLIGGQLRAGLHLTDWMDDRWGGNEPLSKRIATFVATRAVKPRTG